MRRNVLFLGGKPAQAKKNALDCGDVKSEFGIWKNEKQGLSVQGVVVRFDGKSSLS